MPRRKSKKKRSKQKGALIAQDVKRARTNSKPIHTASQKHVKSAQPSDSKESGPLVWWLLPLVLLGLFFLVLKMFTMNAYAGDEHIYLFQAKLVSEGVAPYSGFAMAHPPIQTIFTAFVFKLFGYHFLLGRCLPVLFCLAGGMVLAVMVRREHGSIASIAAAALYLLAYEPLRASSHYTGVNMTVALLLIAVLAYRKGAIRTVALLSVAAVFTRLYAAPGVLALVGYALIANRRQGIRLMAWGAGIGTLVFLAIGFWTGFSDMIHNMLLYHAQKTPMDPGSLDNMRDNVLFHNAEMAAIFVLALVAIIGQLARSYNQGSKKHGPFVSLRTAIIESNIGLVILSTLIGIVFLIILLSMDRVWMYYFIPSFPFAAVAGGWLISKWVKGAMELFRARGKISQTGLSKGALGLGMGLLLLFVLSYFLSPRLEGNLVYYQNSMKKDPKDRVHTYTWQPGLLPDSMNAVVKSTLWSEERTIGEPYARYNYLLWHESRILDVVDEVVETIKRETSPDSYIFGDSGTVPLFALLSGRGIAANEVDTNIQRYRSGNADPKELIKRIDNDKTEMIILRRRFGVAGVKEVMQLVKTKYRPLKNLRTAQGRVFTLFKRHSHKETL